jgi:hypothetical protein
MQYLCSEYVVTFWQEACTVPVDLKILVFKYLLPKELLWMLFIIKVLNKVICLFLGQHWASVW